MREFKPEPPRNDPPPKPDAQPARPAASAASAAREEPQVSWLSAIGMILQAIVVLAGLVAFYVYQDKKAAQAKLAAAAAPVAAPTMLDVAPTAAPAPDVPSGGDSMAFLKKEEGRLDDGYGVSHAAPPPPKQDAAPAQEQQKKKKWEPAKLDRSGGVGLSNFR